MKQTAEQEATREQKAFNRLNRGKKHEAASTDPKPKDTKEAKPKAKKAEGEEPATRGKLGSILGHSVVSVIRAFGKAGWDFETAKASLQKVGVTAAERTIKIGLMRGHKNDGTRRIANLTKAQLDSLKVTPKPAAKKPSTKEAAEPKAK